MSNFILFLKVAYLQARHMKEAVKSFCKSLFYVRMKYQTSDRNLPKNVLLHLFMLIDGLLDTLVERIGVGGFTWLLPEGRRIISSTLVRAIHEKDIVVGSAAYNFTVKLEQVLSPFIDIVSIVSHFFSMVPLQFSFMLSKSISSRNYLEAMIQEQPTQWEVLRLRIFGERNIRVTCNEVFLNYPSECAVLTQFLMQLREYFDMTFQSVDCLLYKKMVYSKAILAGQEPSFRSYRHKAEYLQDMLNGSLKVPVTIEEQEKKGKEPFLKLSNAHFELVIKTKYGITGGWRPQQGNHPPKLASLMVDPMQPLGLLNMMTTFSSVSGIQFTVVFTPITDQIINK